MTVCCGQCYVQGGKNMENSRKKIFIGGLPANITETQLKEQFAQYGTVGVATVSILSCLP